MTRRTLLFPLLLVAVFAVYLSNGRFVESTDTFGNELLPISILEQHNLWFDQYYPLAEDSSDYRLLPETSTATVPWWFVEVHGHVVSLYPIVPGLLNTPAFAVASWLGVPLEPNVVRLTHITTAAVATLSVLFMYLSLRQCCSERAAIFLTLNFAFATAVWSTNSRSLYQHGPSLLFITAALAAMLSRRDKLVALSGLLIGFAVFNRPTNAILAAGLALLVLRYHRSALVPFVALCAIPLGLMTWYSQVAWGTPLALGQGQGGAGFTHGEPLQALIGLLLSPNRGLFVFSPIFIFSLGCAVYVLWRRIGPPVLPYLLWSGVALYALYALWPDWPGGHTYGYRFLIEVVPALMLALAVAWDRLILPRPALRGAFLAACLASMYIHGLGATTAPCGFDEEPNNIDYHHERLWNIADGEIARCTQRQISAVRDAAARL